MVDITILTQRSYHKPTELTPYIQNILEEAYLLSNAIESKGLTVARTYWDNPNYDWTQTKAVVFRTVWDYFERFEEFNKWLDEVNQQTKLINPLKLIRWNIDKHYLKDLSLKGVKIIATEFIDTGKHKLLSSICESRGWSDIVIKPAISGGAFHTYKIKKANISEYEALFKELVAERDMLVQEFQPTIMSRGEASLMVFNGKYTHAILKKAKPGDFRVQDDFGGTVHSYEPSKDEIKLAEKVFTSCNPLPAYGRVDIVWNDKGAPMLSELEIIEPELWVRNNPSSANNLVDGIMQYL
ncbi:ATP-grasp domain-containing protein [Tenacibaculum sp. C7A-26P2]|uniref:ATP-grasp domain-containing protein n=1 Tax=Tenacibaculum sp. C7A-26P2 TaxID=3447504 RepID=UPI003F82DA16